MDNPILHAVHCSDYLLADLIRHIRESDQSENTVIVVVSDHLAMANTASDLLKSSPRYNSMMVIDHSIEKKFTQRTGSPMDIAPTLLGLMGFDVNSLAYGVNLLREGNETFVERNRHPRRVIREQFPYVRSLWRYPSLTKGIRVSADRTRGRIGTHEFPIPSLLSFQKDKRLNHILRGARIVKYAEELHSQLHFVLIDQCLLFRDRRIGDVLPQQLCVATGTGEYVYDIRPLNGTDETWSVLRGVEEGLEPFGSMPAKSIMEILQKIRAGNDVAVRP
jgi:phosphoglycerol transferase